MQHTFNLFISTKNSVSRQTGEVGIIWYVLIVGERILVYCVSDHETYVAFKIQLHKY